MADVKITVDLGGFDKKINHANFKRGQYAMANQMLADIDPFVPYDEGTLAGTGMVESDGEQLSWDTPYARRWFYNSANFQKTSHPRATNRWDLAASGLHMDDWKQAFIRGAGLK